MTKADSLIVLSGGMDSVTMLHEYRSRIALALFFNYGSNHNERELHWARYHCQELGIELVEIPLNFMKEYFASSLLQGADAIPSADYANENLTSTVVPFRNGIMLSIAAGLAESRGLKCVMIANHGGDHELYPDCRPLFIEEMKRAIYAGTYAGIKLMAPYTHFTKAQIALRGKRMELDYNTTYSCYKGGEEQCGFCATCRERRQALIAAGYPDPFPNLPQELCKED